MLFNCNPGCKKGTTSGSYDKESGQVVCDVCSEVLSNISSFAKTNMKLSGPYAKKKKKPFEFKCKSCSKTAEASIQDGHIVGKNCSGQCDLNISSVMQSTLLQLLPKAEEEI